MICLYHIIHQRFIGCLFSSSLSTLAPSSVGLHTLPKGRFGKKTKYHGLFFHSDLGIGLSLKYLFGKVTKRRGCVLSSLTCKSNHPDRIPLLHPHKGVAWGCEGCVRAHNTFDDHCFRKHYFSNYAIYVEFTSSIPIIIHSPFL